MLRLSSRPEGTARRAGTQGQQARSPWVPDNRWCEFRDDKHGALVHRREVLLDHVAVGLEPVAVFDQLAILDGPDLDPATAFVVLARDLHRRHQSAEREALDGFHAVPDLLGTRLGAALGLDGVARGL